MAAALRAGELDAAMLLTEGAVAGAAQGGFKIVSLYTVSPLIWGIHVPAGSDLRNVEDVRGRRYAISRRGSGSHLMSFVHAREQGWSTDDLDFVVVGTLQGAIDAFTSGKADVFFWEKFMTQAARRLRKVQARWRVRRAVAGVRRLRFERRARAAQADRRSAEPGARRGDRACVEPGRGRGDRNTLWARGGRRARVACVDALGAEPGDPRRVPRSGYRATRGSRSNRRRRGAVGSHLVARRVRQRRATTAKSAFKKTAAPGIPRPARRAEAVGAPVAGNRPDHASGKSSSFFHRPQACRGASASARLRLTFLSRGRGFSS